METTIRCLSACFFCFFIFTLPNSSNLLTFTRFRHGICYSWTVGQRSWLHKFGNGATRNRSRNANAQEEGGPTSVNDAASGKVCIEIRKKCIAASHVGSISNQQPPFLHANVVSENIKSLHCRRINGYKFTFERIGKSAIENSCKRPKRSHECRQRNASTYAERSASLQ